MLKSFWLWVQRDRTFALLVSGIVALGAILLGLVYFLYNPQPQPAKTLNAPGSNANPTLAAGVTTTPAVSPTFTLASTDPFESPTPVIARPDPTQIARLPNQGQNPAPPPPPNLVTPASSKAPAPSPGPTVKSPPTPTVKHK